MIQLVCLVAFAVLVVVRAPRAATYESARPALWATVGAVFALSTYGIPSLLSFFQYDALLGGQNVITLVRDLAATAAAWWFREAIARKAGSEGRFGSRWGLAFMVASYTIPFFFIQRPGPTEVDFIINRLDQPAVWLYGCAYMATIIWLAGSTLVIALRSWRGVQSVYILGLSLIIIGSLIEIGFLTASHFGFGGRVFRYSAWDAAELPFFAGVAVIFLGFAWAALGRPLGRRLLLARLHRVAIRHHLISPTLNRGGLRLIFLREQNMVDQAHQLAVLANNAQLQGQFTPNRKERKLIEQARQLIAPDRSFKPMRFGYPEEDAA